MPNTFKYYMYERYSYRVEFDTAGNPIACAILRSNGSWYQIDFGCEIIIKNNSPISEDEAYLLAGVKKK